MTVRNNKPKTPMVGMIYLIGSTVHYVMLPVDAGDRQGEYISTNTTHYEWWNRHIFRILKIANPDFNIEDHEHVPRGRVIYNSAEDVYELMVDRCIRKNKGHMKNIFDTMNLPVRKTKVITNFHYKCHRCRNES